KQIQDRHADDADSQARFLREAEITARLEHPGIVPVYGMDSDEAGRPRYAMRFIRGESLQDAINRFHQADAGRRDPTERTLALRGLLRRFLDTCDAVAYAHSRGVIHRDIKPANVMLGDYGETLVVDWGLAKRVGRRHPAKPGDVVPAETNSTAATVTVEYAPVEPAALTTAGQVVGTPASMAPEQARRE